MRAESDTIIFTILFVYFVGQLLYTILKPRRFDRGRGKSDARKMRRGWHDLKRRAGAMRDSYLKSRRQGAGREDALESAVGDAAVRQSEFDKIYAEEERVEEAKFPARRAPPRREKPARTRFGLIANYAAQDFYTSAGWTATGWGLIFLVLTIPFWIKDLLHPEEGPPVGPYLMTVLIVIWTTIAYLFFRKQWKEKVGSRVRTLRNGEYFAGRITDLEFADGHTTIVYEITGQDGKQWTGRSLPLLYPYCCDRLKGQRIDVYADPSDPSVNEADVFDYRAR